MFELLAKTLPGRRVARSKGALDVEIRARSGRRDKTDLPADDEALAASTSAGGAALVVSTAAE